METVRIVRVEPWPRRIPATLVACAIFDESSHPFPEHLSIYLAIFGISCRMLMRVKYCLQKGLTTG